MTLIYAHDLFGGARPAGHISALEVEESSFRRARNTQARRGAIGGMKSPASYFS